MSDPQATLSATDQLDQIEAMLVPMDYINYLQESAVYDTGKIVGFFPISRLRRLLRLALRLEKP